MFNVLSIFGAALKAEAAKVATEAAAKFAINPAFGQQATSAIEAAVSNLHVPTVIGKVVDQVLPHAAIAWTPSQLKSAEIAALVSQAGNGDVSAASMFAAGAAWAASLVASSITNGVASAAVQLQAQVPAAVDSSIPTLEMSQAIAPGTT